MITFTFDVESIGLHGEGFAVAFLVHIDGQEVSKHANGFDLYAVDESLARGSDEDRQWVRDNVMPIDPTHADLVEMRRDFWSDWRHWSKQGAIMLSDCGWPVESRFLNACIDDKPDVRNWQGPYPLFDVSSILIAVGCDPKGTFVRRDDEKPIHHPMSDARQTARIFWESQEGILPELAKAA